MHQILAGTTKGLCVFHFEDAKLKFIDVSFKGLPVSMVHHDPVSNYFWVGLSMKHWGPKLFRSTDARHWDEVAAPLYAEDHEIALGKPATLRLIWSGFYQSASHKLWIGTEPGGLFESNDLGGSFVLNEALWHHPTRQDHWFGGGRNHAGIHTILDHPKDPDFLLVGVSCGGVYVTRDGGKTWEPKNQGLKADYLPDPYGPFGHDPHMIKMCQLDPDTIWQQNHCGIFVSKDAAGTWKDVTPADGYGSYGFPLAIDNENPDTAWIIPAESDDQRVAKDQRLVVCKTEDGGKTWKKKTSGLPQECCFELTFRHALDRIKGLMVFGTTTGNLFMSLDEGESWKHTQAFLPPIHSINIV